MADFYPLLSRAIGGLPENTPEARKALYERARSVLLSQLRSLEPPLAEADIARQRLLLEDVVRRVEAEQSGVADNPWPDDDPAIAHAPPPPEEEEPRREDEDERPYEDAYERQPDERRDWDRRDLGGVDTGDQGRRPRLGVRSDKSGSGLRKAIFGGIAVVVVGAIAVVAFLTREPTPPAVTLPVDQTQQQESERKLTDRIGGGEAPAGGQQPSQQSQAGKSAGPAGQPGQAGTGGKSQVDAGGQAAQAPAQQSVAGAQRAVLYEEVPGNAQQQQQPRAYPGRAVWRVDSATVGQSQRLDTVVRADVEVPDVGLTLSFIIRRNTDTRLPASHTIEMTFGKTAGGEGRVIKDIGLPQFKGEENARGTPISGVPAPVADNFFLVGLSNLPADIPKNLDLMRSKSWIDIPILYDNKRRGVLAFEKGPTGEQAISDAFGVWGQ